MCGKRSGIAVGVAVPPVCWSQLIVSTLAVRQVFSGCLELLSLCNEECDSSRRALLLQPRTFEADTCSCAACSCCYNL
jgi:hypothetical protein